MSKIVPSLRACLLVAAFGLTASAGAQAQLIAVYQVKITPNAGQKMPSTTAYININNPVNPTSSHSIDFMLSNVNMSYVGLPGFICFVTNTGYSGHSNTNLANTSIVQKADKTIAFQATIITTGTLNGWENCYSSANVNQYLDPMMTGGTVSFVVSSDTKTLISGTINIASPFDGTTYLATFKGVRIQ